jgi:cytosine/adenosine deaminase-related metal-dependent hydrolase
MTIAAEDACGAGIGFVAQLTALAFLCSGLPVTRPGPSLHAGGQLDPYEALVTCAQPRHVDTLMVDGRVLVRGGRFTALDHAEGLRQANESAAALRGRTNWT